jgi:hypothetical protein
LQPVAPYGEKVDGEGADIIGADFAVQTSFDVDDFHARASDDGFTGIGYDAVYGRGLSPTREGREYKRKNT